MTRIIIHGANGYMGRVVAEQAAADNEVTVVAGLDISDSGRYDFPVYANAADCMQEADVVIDFSVAQAVDGLLDFCEKRKLPVVLCTTGLSEEQLAKVEALSKKTAVLRSANMSLGVNALLALVKKAAEVFAPEGFDMEIVERHHNRKLDAPSGTAIALADAMNEALGNTYEYVYDRSGRRQPRDPKEIGISAVRGGNIVGQHEVIFAGTDEVVTISHQATSRAVFGKGAIAAAKFLCGKEPGMYNMLDVVG